MSEGRARTIIVGQSERRKVDDIGQKVTVREDRVSERQGRVRQRESVKEVRGKASVMRTQKHVATRL